LAGGLPGLRVSMGRGGTRIERIFADQIRANPLHPRSSASCVLPGGPRLMNPSEAQHEVRLSELLEEALSGLRAGRVVDTLSYQPRHPDLADDLPVLLGMMLNLDIAAENWKSLSRAAGPDPDPAASPQDTPSQPATEKRPPEVTG